jgi:hypothetical protein
MIAPYREWWWEEVLYQGDDNPETKEEVIKRIAENEQITEFSAKRITNGAREDGIIHFANDGYPIYDGVDVAEPSEEPAYVHTARQLSKDGIVRLGDSDVLATSPRVLVQRASSTKDATRQSKVLADNKIRADDLVDYIQKVTRVNESRARIVFEQNSSLEVNDNIVECLPVTDEMELYDIIEPDFHRYPI